MTACQRLLREVPAPRENSLKTNQTEVKDAGLSDGCEGLRFQTQPASYQQLHGIRRPGGATFFV